MLSQNKYFMEKKIILFYNVPVKPPKVKVRSVSGGATVASGRRKRDSPEATTLMFFFFLYK